MERQTLSVSLDADNRIVIRVGNEFQTGETHYLAMEASDANRRAALWQALQTLLQDWISLLNRSCNGDIVYLPFDFSDEATSWLACHCDHTEFTLVFGRMDIEGWEIASGNWHRQTDFPLRFVVNEPANPQTFDRAHVLRKLQQGLEQLPGQEQL